MLGLLPCSSLNVPHVPMSVNSTFNLNCHTPTPHPHSSLLYPHLIKARQETLFLETPLSPLLLSSLMHELSCLHCCVLTCIPALALQFAGHWNQVPFVLFELQVLPYSPGQRTLVSLSIKFEPFVMTSAFLGMHFYPSDQWKPPPVSKGPSLLPSPCSRPVLFLCFSFLLISPFPPTNNYFVGHIDV